jgi:hypothetical protein
MSCGDVAPVILNFVTRCNGMVRHPRRCCFTYGEDHSIPIELEAGWATERVSTIWVRRKICPCRELHIASVFGLIG